MDVSSVGPANPLMDTHEHHTGTWMVVLMDAQIHKHTKCKEKPELTGGQMHRQTNEPMDRQLKWSEPSNGGTRRLISVHSRLI